MKSMEDEKLWLINLLQIGRKNNSSIRSVTYAHKNYYPPKNKIKNNNNNNKRKDGFFQLFIVRKI